MPTFFARRTMRGKPRRTERVIGASILAMLALIVTAFLLTSGLLGDTLKDAAVTYGIKTVLGIGDRPLFQIDPAHRKPASAGGERPLAPSDVPEIPQQTAPASSAASAASVPAAAPVAAVAGRARFVDPGDAEILAPIEIERYTDNLYEKIDGREGQFRAFHFVELRFGRYADTRHEQTFDVYLYDMAEPANALGIYASERSGDVQAIDLGRGGYASGTSVYFWKGKFYVYVLGPVEGDETAARTAERIAAAVAATIADDGKPFWAEALLPGKERIPSSLSYRATSALGYDFLERMFLADYKSGEQPYQLYVLKTDSPVAARELFNRFAEATAKYDTVLARDDSSGSENIVSETLGIYSVAFCKGSYFGGVIECENRALAEERATAFRKSLPAQ